MLNYITILQTFVIAVINQLLFLRRRTSNGIHVYTIYICRATTEVKTDSCNASDTPAACINSVPVI